MHHFLHFPDTRVITSLLHSSSHPENSVLAAVEPASPTKSGEYTNTPMIMQINTQPNNHVNFLSQKPRTAAPPAANRAKRTRTSVINSSYAVLTGPSPVFVSMMTAFNIRLSSSIDHPSSLLNVENQPPPSLLSQMDFIWNGKYRSRCEIFHFHYHLDTIALILLKYLDVFDFIESKDPHHSGITFFIPKMISDFVRTAGGVVLEENL